MNNIEVFAKELIEKYNPYVNSFYASGDGGWDNSDEITKEKNATACAIQSCRSTVEELKLQEHVMYFKGRIKFFEQVIEQLNK